MVELVVKTISINLILGLLVFFSSGCSTQQEKDYQKGISYQNNSEFREAVVEFEKAMKRQPGTSVALNAARERAKILLYEIKNYEGVIDTLKYLILYSDIPEERWKAQSQIAQIYFDNLAWYDKALIEYSKLLSSQLSKEEQIRIKLAIARSYYHLGQMQQSWNEAKQILVVPGISQDTAFDVLLLQANVQLALKNFTEAAKSLEEIMKRFPERSKRENVGINLAICYEELGVYKEAIRVLESLLSYYQPKEFIELRLKKIKGRLLNQPKKRLKK